MGDNSIFKKASEAKLQTEIAKAREQLELTFGRAKIVKHTDREYDQDKYLNELMKKEIPNIEIKGDIVIVNGYAFEIDRSEPKIGQYIGKKSDLAFPTIETTVTLSEERRTATIHITAKESKNGISKIEVIQGDYVLETFECGNTKEEVEKDYIAKQNGTYTIKVYAGLTVKELAEVDGIEMLVKYSPNGSKTYKREHEVALVASEKVKSIKYQWLQTTVEPEENTFEQTYTSGEKIKKDKVTGTWYLWILVETESGKKSVERSEAFHFDNEGPTVELTTTPVSETSFTLTATANDAYSEIAKYEFYVDDKLEATQTTTAERAEYTWNGTEISEKECYVIVTDKLGNTSKKTITGKTIMYAWEKFECTSTSSFEMVKISSGSSRYLNSASLKYYTSFQINSDGSVEFSNLRTKNIDAGGSFSLSGWQSNETFVAKGERFSGFTSYSANWRDYGGGLPQQLIIMVYFDNYQVEEKLSYEKSDISLGYVTSPNPEKYADNERDDDGYWYVRVENR